MTNSPSKTNTPQRLDVFVGYQLVELSVRTFARGKKGFHREPLRTFLRESEAKDHFEKEFGGGSQELIPVGGATRQLFRRMIGEQHPRHEIRKVPVVVIDDRVIHIGRT